MKKLIVVLLLLVPVSVWGGEPLDLRPYDFSDPVVQDAMKNHLDFYSPIGFWKWNNEKQRYDLPKIIPGEKKEPKCRWKFIEEDILYKLHVNHPLGRWKVVTRGEIYEVIVSGSDHSEMYRFTLDELISYLIDKKYNGWEPIQFNFEADTVWLRRKVCEEGE